MKREEIKQAIVDYLALLENVDSVEEREIKLKFALDKLALAYHFADYVFDETDYADAPHEDYEKLYKIVCEKFPNFSYYNGAGKISTHLGAIDFVVGDAIDDIADIAIDLSEVIYRWKNTSTDDALWHFKFTFESHWEKHLRNLQLYLCALRNDY